MLMGIVVVELRLILSAAREKRKEPKEHVDAIIRWFVGLQNACGLFKRRKRMVTARRLIPQEDLHRRQCRQDAGHSRQHPCTLPLGYKDQTGVI